jgi:hypothetical protein
MHAQITRVAADDVTQPAHIQYVIVLSPSLLEARAYCFPTP